MTSLTYEVSFPIPACGANRNLQIYIIPYSALHFLIAIGAPEATAAAPAPPV